MYVRTKDWIYDTENLHYRWIENNKVYKVGWDVEKPTFEADIIKQSENLDELCDEFVFVNKVGNFDKSYVIHYNMPNHIFTEPTAKEKIAYIKKYYKDELDKIRGAIYTDEGLIYRAKFNESGDLELI